jgi:PAS domain S-box-containing protein
MCSRFQKVTVGTARFARSMINTVRGNPWTSGPLRTHTLAAPNTAAAELPSSNIFAHAFEASNDAILLVNADGQIEQINEATEEVFGYSREELTGQPVELLLPESFRRAHMHHRQAYVDAPRTRRMSTSNQLYALRRDGTVLPVDVSLTPVGGGPQFGVIVIARNAAGRRAAEAALRERDQLADELAHTRKLEALGRLAGGVAHDFNNLLTVIRGNADLLRATEAGDDRRCEMLDEIRRAAERGATLTHQLLTLGRRQVLHTRIVDLNSTLTAAEGLLQRLIGETIVLIVVPHDGLARVVVDEGQIESVLLNLASNARDAMPAGGTLRIELGNLTLPNALSVPSLPEPVPPGSYVLLTVRDTGHGMTLPTLEHVFEPFFTTKPPGRGTGLGLASVYGIIKQSGGYIWMESTPGRGTTVNIVLPVARGAEQHD